jgi:hypothetical protein
MIIRNDNIREATLGSDVIPFTPANFRNLGDWWSSDFGVNLTGTDVDSWVGINGNVFTPRETDFKAIYDSSDADFNGRPSIGTNPGGFDVGYTASVIAGVTNKTIIMVSKILTTTEETGTMLMLNNTADFQRAGIIGKTEKPSAYTDGTGPGAEIYYPLDNAVTNSAGDYLVSMIQYQRGLGIIQAFASNTSSLPISPGYTASNRFSDLAFDMVSFAYYNNVIASSRFKLTDFIAINGIPSEEEIIAFNAYVATRYGF